MSVWRGWVLPLLKVALLMIVAVALVKIAFFPDTSTEAEELVPTGELVDPTVVVETGSIVNDLNLSGTVASEAATPARAVISGQLSSLLVSVGQVVNEGETIAVVRHEVVPGVEGTDDTAGSDPVYREAGILAPVSGTIQSTAVLVEQEVAVGDAIAQVSPGRFEVTAQVQPEQLYALQNKPKEAAVSITGGPADVTCTDLTIGAAVTAGDPDGEGATESTGPQLRCMIPDDVTVFDGLSATVTIAGSSVEDVLVLPATAVKGRAGQGSVFTVGDDGEPVEVEVGIGLSDGTMVEITKGLDEGDEVLQFLPVDDPTDTGAMTDDCELNGFTAEECAEMFEG